MSAIRRAATQPDRIGSNVMGSCLRVFVLAVSASLATAAQVDFNRDIRPILSDKCYTCHGPDSANRKTALRFDTEAGAKVELRNHRPAIVPGDPARSELYLRINSGDKAYRMPPAYLGHAVAILIER